MEENDDPPRALRPHMRQAELDETRRADEAGLHLAAALVHRHDFERPVVSVSGVVDQNIETSLLADDPLHRGDHRGVVGDVERDHTAPRRGGILHAVRAARPPVDHVPLRQETQGEVLGYAR